LRAKALGVTPAEEALRLLVGGGQRVAAPEAAREAHDLLEERNGVLVFTGPIDPASIPGVDDVREERLDALIRGDEEGRD
jgi:hypothetical protein